MDFKIGFLKQSTIAAAIKWTSSKADPKEDQPKAHRTATAFLTGKSMAQDILTAGAIWQAFPEFEDRQDVLQEARDFANGVAEALKKRSNNLQLVESFMQGANDTINRVSGMVLDSDEVP